MAMAGKASKLQQVYTNRQTRSKQTKDQPPVAFSFIGRWYHFTAAQKVRAVKNVDMVYTPPSTAETTQR